MDEHDPYEPCGSVNPYDTNLVCVNKGRHAQHFARGASWPNREFIAPVGRKPKGQLRDVANRVHRYKNDQANEAAAARQAGIEKADDGASDEWKANAYEAIEWCAAHHGEFTADEVWARLEAVLAPGTHEPAAIGPVFLRAQRAGVIENTHTLRPTVNARRHRDLTVWRAIKKS